MSTAAATATATDAQTWVFPPQGVPTPPIAQTSDFGPVHLGDSMVLDWSPATKPEIRLTCQTDSNELENSILAKLVAPPLEYKFSDAQNSNGSDNIFCHVWFLPSSNGNSVNFQFLNQLGDEPKTWSGKAAAVSTSASASGSTRSTATASAASASSVSSDTSVPSGTAAPQSKKSGLSTGASAGIGIGVALLVILLAILAFFLIKKRRTKTKGTGGVAELHGEGYSGVPQQEYKSGGGHGEKPPAHLPPSELEGSPSAHQMQ